MRAFPRTVRCAVLLGLLGTAADAAPIAAQDVIHLLSGATGDDFGIAVSDVGDIDQDGFADVAVGAIQNGAPSAGAGYVRVHSGRDGAVLLTFSGDDPGDTFGNSVGSAGDLNSDGVPDVVVGAIWDDVTGAFGGSVRVHSGADGTVLLSVPADAGGDFFATRVSGAGDVNGDGTPDILVGAVQFLFAGNGYARILSGADGSTLHNWTGAHSNCQFGYSVSDLGDVNVDGVPDVAVGAWFENLAGQGSGSVQVFSGATGSTLATYAGLPGAHLGASVATAGDVDGDGVPDLIMGASGDPTAGAYAGGAFVRSGLSGTLLHSFYGFAPGDQFGNAVHGAGDVNGDGRDDLVVGAIRASPMGQYSGSAYVFSGLDGARLLQLDGVQTNDFLGCAVSGAGDVNGDGAADVIVGAKLSDLGQPDGGAALVLSGRAFAEPFGQGCAGLSSSLTGTPALGSSITLGLTGAVPSVPAWPFLGGSDRSWLGLPLPLDLASLGAPGCNLLVAPTLLQPTQVVDALGAASLVIMVPTDPGIVGATVHAQWASIDPVALATSNGLHITLQP